MKTTVYYSSSSLSYRQIKTFVNENGIDCAYQNVNNESMTKTELMEILSHTENGVEDILSTRSGAYHTLIDQGVDFDELSLTQFHELVEEYPNLVRLPIMISKNSVMIGYNSEEVGVFAPRKKKREMFNEIMKKMREMDQLEEDLITA